MLLNKQSAIYEGCECCFLYKKNDTTKTNKNLIDAIPGYTHRLILLADSLICLVLTFFLEADK